MDDETYEWLSGTLTAQTFVLENIYALLLRNDPDPLTACQRTRDEMLRQFTQLGPRHAPMDALQRQRILKHGVNHVQALWRNVEARLRSAAPGG